MLEHSSRISFKKYISTWLKLWPLTILIFVVCISAIFVDNKISKTEYSRTVSYFISIDQRNISAIDYSAIISSDLLFGKYNKEIASGLCEIENKPGGSYIESTVSCTDKQHTDRITNKIKKNIPNQVSEITNNDAKITILSDSKTAAKSTKKLGATRAVLVLIFGFLSSLGIALIHLDYSIRKQTDDKKEK